MKGALDEIGILDFSRGQMGPYCSVMLSDMGANVIKVEEPGSGDSGRTLGNSFVNGESAYFLALNRNKRSLTLDLTQPKAKEIIYRLVEKSDVVLSNFRPGVMKRLGFGYEDLVKYNDKIIMASGSAFGQDGPLAWKPGIDLIVQGMSGIMTMNGHPGDPPTAVAVPIVDMVGAMWLAYGIVVALHARNKYGIGQEIAVSLLDGQLALHSNMLSAYLVSDKVPGKAGSGNAGVAPYQACRTKDGHIMVAIVHDNFWPKFCKAIGITHLQDDPKFKTNLTRNENKEDLIKIIEDILKTKNSEEWLRILDEHDVLSGPVWTYKELVESPQVIHNKMIQEINHPRAGRVRVTPSPVKLSKTPASIQLPPPLLGQHNQEILAGLGYSEADIDEMGANGVLEWLEK